MPKWLQIIIGAASVAPAIMKAGHANGTLEAISVGIDASNSIAQAVLDDPQQKAEAQVSHDLANNIFNAFKNVYAGGGDPIPPGK